MKLIKAVSTAVILIIAASTVVPGTAIAADHTATPAQEDPGTGQDRDTGDTNGSAKELVKGLVSAFLGAVQWLTNRLSDLLTRIFVSYPDVTQQRVVEIHQKVFRVSLVLSAAAVVWIGILRMANQTDGIRPLMFIVGAVAFGAVAPTLLWYPVEISRLTTEALLPTNPDFWAVSRLTLELALVALLDAFFLLGIAAIFIARDVILMAGIVLSPLVGLMMGTPRLRRFGDLLVNLWAGSLLIGPINAVIFDLTLALLKTNGNIPHWLWALGGISLMFGLPLILLGAGAVMFAPMTRIAAQTTGIARRQAVSFAVRHQSRSENREPRTEYGQRNRDNPHRRR